jgi:hydrogenase maturation protease
VSACAGAERSHILLLGVGNLHRRDDGIGPAIAERLKPRLSPRCRQAVERGDDVARLVTAWEGFDAAFVVDAALSGEAPGTLSVSDGADKRGAAAVRHPSSHGFGLLEAAALSRALGGLPETFRIISVAARDFGQGDGLSPALAARLDALAEEVAAVLPADAFPKEVLPCARTR